MGLTSFDRIGVGVFDVGDRSKERPLIDLGSRVAIHDTSLTISLRLHERYQCKEHVRYILRGVCIPQLRTTSLVELVNLVN